MRDAGAIAGWWTAAVLAVARAWLLVRFPRLHVLFWRRVGYWPNVTAPRSFREKTQWRKVFDHNARFVELQDKLRCKRVVAALLPQLRMPAVVWSGTDASTVPLHVLPEVFYLKANHGSGFNVRMARDEPGLRDRLIGKSRALLARRWGRMNREWAYAKIEPALLIEEELRAANGGDPAEYSVIVMNGRPTVVTAKRTVAGRALFGYYSPDWTRLPVLIGDGSRDADVAPPTCLSSLLHAAGAIGGLVDMLRVDFYDVDGVVYFGECTVYSTSGMLPIRPPRFDFEWGAQWDLRRSAFFSAELGALGRLYRRALKSRLDLTDPAATDPGTDR